MQFILPLFCLLLRFAPSHLIPIKVMQQSDHIKPKRGNRALIYFFSLKHLPNHLHILCVHDFSVLFPPYHSDPTVPSLISIWASCLLLSPMQTFDGPGLLFSRLFCPDMCLALVLLLQLCYHVQSKNLFLLSGMWP